MRTYYFIRCKASSEHLSIGSRRSGDQEGSLMLNTEDDFHRMLDVWNAQAGTTGIVYSRCYSMELLAAAAETCKAAIRREDTLAQCLTQVLYETLRDEIVQREGLPQKEVPALEDWVPGLARTTASAVRKMRQQQSQGGERGLSESSFD